VICSWFCDCHVAQGQWFEVLIVVIVKVMIAATLWIEIIIAGFVYLAGMFFLVATVFGVKHLPAQTIGKDFLPYLSALVVGTSYVTGTRCGLDFRRPNHGKSIDYR
jgi:hypothetical protein